MDEISSTHITYKPFNVAKSKANDDADPNAAFNSNPNSPDGRST
jgi:hypothetical protein